MGSISHRKLRPRGSGFSEKVFHSGKKLTKTHGSSFPGRISLRKNKASRIGFLRRRFFPLKKENRTPNSRIKFFGPHFATKKKHAGRGSGFWSRIGFLRRRFITREIQAEKVFGTLLPYNYKSGSSLPRRCANAPMARPALLGFSGDGVFMSYVHASLIISRRIQGTRGKSFGRAQYTLLPTSVYLKSNISLLNYQKYCTVCEGIQVD